MGWETRYSRPDDRAIEDVVWAALDGHRVDRSEWEIIETGSSHVVVLAGAVAVRVARDESAGAELRRVQQLVDRLPELPFAVPRSAEPIIDHLGLIAVPTRRLVGGCTRTVRVIQRCYAGYRMRSMRLLLSRCATGWHHGGPLPVARGGYR